jgi:hypothetical protein
VPTRPPEPPAGGAIPNPTAEPAREGPSPSLSPRT